MRPGLPSVTAAAVALGRGLASVGAPPAPDPVASRLLGPLGAPLRALTSLGRRAPIDLPLRVASLGFIDHIALRTAAIDAALLASLARGVDQLVILGAGLDARAYRLEALRDATVLEVDHPATQRWKRAHVAGNVPCAKEVRFVAVDFARDRLEERLAAEGHDADKPTFWIWEGVVPYLEEPAVRASLAALRARSAPTSELAVTYGLARDSLWLRRLAPIVHASFRALGEPLVGLTTKPAFHALLASSGWRVRDDDGPAEWRARFRYGVPRLPTIEERLAVAVA